MNNLHQVSRWFSFAHFLKWLWDSISCGSQWFVSFILLFCELLRKAPLPLSSMMSLREPFDTHAESAFPWESSRSWDELAFDSSNGINETRRRSRSHLFTEEGGTDVSLSFSLIFVKASFTEFHWKHEKDWSYENVFYLRVTQLEVDDQILRVLSFIDPSSRRHCIPLKRINIFQLWMHMITWRSMNMWLETTFLWVGCEIVVNRERESTISREVAMSSNRFVERQQANNWLSTNHW